MGRGHGQDERRYCGHVRTQGRVSHPSLTEEDCITAFEMHCSSLLEVLATPLRSAIDAALLPLLPEELRAAAEARRRGGSNGAAGEASTAVPSTAGAGEQPVMADVLVLPAPLRRYREADALLSSVEEAREAWLATTAPQQFKWVRV